LITISTNHSKSKLISKKNPLIAWNLQDPFLLASKSRFPVDFRLYLIIKLMLGQLQKSKKEQKIYKSLAKLVNV
jgi:hypothetical protein